MTQQKGDVVFRFSGLDGISGVAKKISRNLGGLSRLGGGLRGLTAPLAGVARGFSALAGPLSVLSGAGLIGGLSKSLTLFSSIGDEAAKMARSLNMSAGAYRELGYWADRSGIATEQWRMAQIAFNTRIAQADGGNNQVVSDLLASLKIDLRDANGVMRSTDALLSDLAVAFENNTDTATRSRMASALFGEEVGIRMVDALANGADVMAELRKEAVRLGITMSQEDAAAAEKLTDQWTNLTRVGEGLSFTIGSRLAPIVGPLIEQFTDWVVVNKDLIATRVESVALKLSAALEGIDWVALGDGLSGFGEGVASLVDLVGGWDNAAIGLVAVLNGPLIASVIQLGLAFGKLGLVLLTNPIGLVIAGIAYGASLIIRNWDALAGWFETMWGNVTGVFRGAVDTITGLLTGDLGLAFDGITAIGSGLVAVWRGIGQGIVAVIRAVVGDIGALFGVDLVAIFDQQVAALTGFVEGWTDPIRGLVDFVAGCFRQLAQLGDDLIGGFRQVQAMIPDLPDWLGGGDDAPAADPNARPGAIGAALLRQSAAAGAVGGGVSSAPVQVNTIISGQVDRVETSVDNGSERVRDTNFGGALALAGG